MNKSGRKHTQTNSLQIPLGASLLKLSTKRIWSATQLIRMMVVGRNTKHLYNLQASILVQNDKEDSNPNDDNQEQKCIEQRAKQFSSSTIACIFCIHLIYCWTVIAN